MRVTEGVPINNTLSLINILINILIYILIYILIHIMIYITYMVRERQGGGGGGDIRREVY
jgi:hypothetical protein